MKEKLKKSKILKAIIKKELGVDITKVSRIKEIVEGRNMYFLILREKENNTYQFIADTIKKNHATILHGQKAIKQWMVNDSCLKERYSKVLNEFYKETRGKKIANQLIQLEELPIVTNNNIIPYYLIDLISKIPKEKHDELKTRIEAFVKMIEITENNND